MNLRRVESCFMIMWFIIALVLIIVIIDGLMGGQNPQQAVTPNQAVEHVDHSWQEGMFKTLMESSWPRYALLLIAVVLGVYFKWGRKRGGRTP